MPLKYALWKESSDSVLILNKVRRMGPLSRLSPPASRNLLGTENLGEQQSARGKWTQTTFHPWLVFQPI